MLSTSARTLMTLVIGIAVAHVPASAFDIPNQNRTEAPRAAGAILDLRGWDFRRD